MSELVEKVARVIAEDDWEQAPEGRAGQRMMQNRDGTFRDINALSRDEYRDQARAAIAAVAEWLDPKEIPMVLADAPAEIIAAYLRGQLEQPKGAAGDGR